MDLMDSANQSTLELSKKRKPKGFLQLWMSRSTIPPVVQINSSTHTTARVFWCLLLLSGLTISSYQSYILITAYFRFSVKEKESVVLKSPPPIPAVTLCSNTLINWNSTDAIETVNISEIIKERNVTHTDEMDIYQAEISHDEVILKLKEFNETQRINLGIDLTKYLEFFMFGNGDTIDEDIMAVESNNLFYGNCVTLDANMHRNHSFKAGGHSGYYFMAVYVQSDAGFVHMLRPKTIVGTIHRSGAPPIMTLENIFQVYPGEMLDIRVAQKEINRLPWPYESECVQNDSPSEQWKSLYHSEERPFLYTVEACRVSCLQNLSYTYCNCIDPMSGTRGELPGVNRICYYGCSLIPAHEIVRMCGCRNSCGHLEFAFQVRRNQNMLQYSTYQRQLMNSLKMRKPGSSRKQREALLKNVGFLLISTSSGFAKLVEEEAAITAADLGGAIGGVFGLWIGLSAMSLFEVFVACEITIVSYLKRIRSQHGRKTAHLSESQQSK